MSKLTKCFLFSVSTIAIFLFLFLSDCFIVKSSAKALGESESYILVSSYEVKGNKLIPGEEFSFSLTLKNPSETVTAHDVMVNVQGENGISTVYPSFSQVYVGTMLPLEEQTVSINFALSDKFIYDYAEFFITLSSQTKSNSLTVTVPVDIEKRLITAVSATFPEHTACTELVTSAVVLKSFSDDNLSNVVMNIYVDDYLAVSSSIGNISAGATKTQNASFYLNEVGKHDIKVCVQCANSSGKTYELDVYKTAITVNEQDLNDASDLYDEESYIEYSDRDIAIMATCLGMTLVMVLGIVVVIKHYN